MNNRTKNVYINSIVALSGQLFQIFLSFAVRKIFITTLGVSYLGYNSVFTNILQMLNLADLGIGVAITSFLYKPLAGGDKSRVSALMNLYKKYYTIMGFIVLSIGMIVSLFLEYIIPDSAVSLWYLRILFYINLAGTVSTYFLAYKRTLIVADQKSYIVNASDAIINFLMTAMQIICLLFFPSYIIFLSLNIAKNVLSNIILSIKCDRLYGKFEDDSSRQYYAEYSPQILKYVKEVFVSRIGAVVFYGTDNVIISVFRGSLLAGFLSNYTMITVHLTNIVNQLLASLQATFGNYINSGRSIEEQRRMTDNYLCVNYIIGNFCMVCFILLVQPFIKNYFELKYVLSFSTAMWLGINLLLSVMMQLPSQVFTIYKLFKYDRPIIIVSASLNILISACLVRKLGIDGVLIGTFVTSLIYLFSRFFIISRHVYHISYSTYVFKMARYFCLSAFTLVIAHISCKGIEGDRWIFFFLRALLIAGIALMVPFSFLSFTREFQFLVDKMAPKKLKKYMAPQVFALAAAACIGAAFLFGLKFGGNGIDHTNKSTKRSTVYQQEEEYKEKIFHFSIDDTIDCFQDITEKEYQSIFDNATFGWLRTLHKNYGIVVSCYVFYENESFNLSKCTGRFKEEFLENSDWLRFGFHTKRGDVTYESGEIIKDYEIVVTELERIVGEKAIDNIIRLQSYQGSKENIQALTKVNHQPITGLLTADDSRNSYYLKKEENEYIYCHDKLFDQNMGILLISTDIRAEYVDNVNQKIREFSQDSWNNQLGNMEVFTHEWALNGETKATVERLCRWANANGYVSCFLEDR